MATLVLGATGRLGPSIVAALSSAGEPVRALVRDPGKARPLLASDCDLIEGDFTDATSVAEHLSEGDALVLLTPHGSEMARVQVALVDAAARAGARVIKISGTSSLISPDGPEACRAHWEVEQHLVASGGRHVIVRPNAFMQGLVAGVVAEARATGTVMDPIGGAAINAVDCRDIADAVAAVIADPHHDGETLVITGSRSVTFPELADLISVAGVPAVARPGSPTDAGDRLRTRGVSEWEAHHLEEMLSHFAEGAADFTAPDLADLLGREARTVVAYIQELVAVVPASS